MIVPHAVPEITVNMYHVAVAAGISVGLIASVDIAADRNPLNRLTMTDALEVGALTLLASVGTDLAECLILPGLVVGLAELIATAEVLVARYTDGDSLPEFEPLDMEILRTAPMAIMVGLVVYGVLLTGFTGGAVAGSGAAFYLFSRANRPHYEEWRGMESISGIGWAFWVAGFSTFFLHPEAWLLALILAGTGGILVKVGPKLTLLGYAMGYDVRAGAQRRVPER
ncbi:EhaG family protein [Methanopyrus sp.]